MTQPAFGDNRTRWVDTPWESPTSLPLVVAGSTLAITQRLGDPASLLSETELRRAARFRSRSDSSDFVAAHALVRVVAGLLLGVSGHELTLVQQCKTCGGDHGRPSIAESQSAQVSLSHARGVVAAVAGFGPVGVDVDGPRGQGTDAGLAKMALSPSELDVVRAAPDADLAFLRFWVRKESFVKLGQLTLDSLTTMDLSNLPTETTWRDGATRHLTWKGWHLLDWFNPTLPAVGSAIAMTPPQLVEWD